VKIVYIKPFSVGVGRDTITMDSDFGTITLIQKEMVVVMIIKLGFNHSLFGNNYHNFNKDGLIRY